MYQSKKGDKNISNPLLESVFNFNTMYSYQLLLSRAFDKNHIIFSYKVFAGIFC